MDLFIWDLDEIEKETVREKETEKEEIRKVMLREDELKETE